MRGGVSWGRKSAGPADGLDPSCASVADGDFLPLDDDRHLALAPRGFQHRIHILRRSFYVDVLMIPVGLTGLLGVGSSRFAVNADRFSH